VGVAGGAGVLVGFGDGDGDGVMATTAQAVPALPTIGLMVGLAGRPPDGDG
jgi:hypothetical protein